MNKVKSRINYIILILLIVIMCFFFFIFCKNNQNLNFYDANLVEISGLIIDLAVLFIGTILLFLLATRNEEKNKKKELLLKIIEKLEIMLEDNKIIKIENLDDPRDYHTLNKQIKYRLDLLTNKSCKYIDSEDLLYIKEEYSKHEIVVGDYIDRLSRLSEERNKLDRLTSNILNKLEDIKLSFYD